MGSAATKNNIGDDPDGGPIQRDMSPPSPPSNVSDEELSVQSSARSDDDDQPVNVLNVSKGEESLEGMSIGDNSIHTGERLRGRGSLERRKGPTRLKGQIRIAGLKLFGL